MIIDAHKIAEYLSASDDPDPLIVTPLPDVASLRNKGAASLDLRLGCWFVTLRQTRMTCIDPIGENSDSGHGNISKEFFIPFGQYFVLHPGTFTLGVTLEWIRLKRDIAGVVTGKSSWGRRGLVIATATGVHPGFTGCLTLEITNLGEIPILIYPGMEICQIFMHRVESPGNFVDDSQYNGRRKPALGRVNIDRVSKALAQPE